MSQTSLFESQTARFSPDRRYRYTLHRTWDSEKPRLCVIALNPSTADEVKLDPTLRKDIGFARRWGCGGVAKTNLYAYRSTDPDELLKLSLEERTGPLNDDAILTEARTAKVVLVAWGNHRSVRDRAPAAIEMLMAAGVAMVSLGRNQDGTPPHPLFVPYDRVPVPYPLVTFP